MNSMRKRVMVLAALLTLAVGQVWGQWILPASPDKLTDAQKPVDLRNGKNPGMDLMYYEAFEEQPPTVVTGWGKIPTGWSQEMVQADGSGGQSYWTVSPGGGKPRDEAMRSPLNAFDGKYNVLCHGKTTGSQQRLVSPVLDLTKVKNGDPRLVFYYAAPRFNGFCRLRLQYRVGTTGTWVDIPMAPELGNEEGWTQISVRLPQKLRESPNVQLGFLSIQNNGYGTAIDEVYVVNMVGAHAKVKFFDPRPSSPMVAKGSKKNPLMCINVAVAPGGGKLKLEYVNNGADTVSTVHFTAKDGKTYLDALDNLSLYVGLGSNFSSAKLAGTLATTGGNGAPYTITGWKQVVDAEALVMYGGNSYSIWIVADVKDKYGALNDKEVPLKSLAWVSIRERSLGLTWYEADAASTSTGGKEKNFFPTKGNSYNTPDLERSVVYKSLFFDNFDGGDFDTKWKRSGASEQLWNVGNPAPNGTVYTSANKRRPDAQVDEAFSPSSVLATGEILSGDVLRARYFSSMVLADDPSRGHWVEVKNPADPNGMIDASTVKDVYLLMQKSFNIPYGMTFYVEGKYENETSWIEFARYNMSSSDWKGWQQQGLRLPKADGRKFNIRLRAYYGGATTNLTGFIIDDFRLIGNEVQDDLGITDLQVTDSWDNGVGRKVKFKVRNYGTNLQSDVKYEVYVDGRSAGATQSIAGSLASGAVQDVECALNLDEFLRADLKKDNTHNVEVRVILRDGVTDEDKSNNIRQIKTYSYPVITVTDTESYPRNFGDPMRHWFGRPYKEGYGSSWLFGSVYDVSKCRDSKGVLSGTFGSGMLLGNYLWTTGDQIAMGYEQSVLESPIFEISTTASDKQKEFVMAYAADGEMVEVQVEYRTPGSDWVRLEKSKDWEQGWYDAGENWKGEMGRYVTVKTLLPDALQGVGGSKAKVQFRIYFFNRSPERVEGLAVNGVEIRTLRPDLTIVDHTPKGGCANPLGINETLKVTIKNNAKPAVVWLGRTLPVVVSVTRAGHTTQVVKLANVPKLAPGETWAFDTEVQLPWGAEQGVSSEFRVELMPQSGSKGEADEDTGNNVYPEDMGSAKSIEAKVPGDLPIKEVVLESGQYVLYTTVGKVHRLLTKPGDSYSGYTFESFSVTADGGNATVSGTDFQVGQLGRIMFNYKVTESGCDVSLPIELKQGVCDVYVSAVDTVTQVNCVREGVDLTFKVTVKNNGSSPTGLGLIVTQGGRELYKGAAQLGENTVKVNGAKSGGGELKFIAKADADMDGSNNSFDYPEILLYPNPLTVFLQDVEDTYYMREVKSGPGMEENTYGTRRWQFYVPRLSGIENVQWKFKDFDQQGLESGFKVPLGASSGVYRAYVAPKNGKRECALEQVFEVKVNNDDIEVQGLGGATGLPTLCAEADGSYNLYVGLVNHSWGYYVETEVMHFRLSKPDGSNPVEMDVPVGSVWNPQLVRQFSLGKLPDALKPAAGAKSVDLTIEYLGIWTDVDKVALSVDANLVNNKQTTTLKLSQSPILKWVGIQEDSQRKEYIVKKVFPVGSSQLTDQLTVESDGEAGTSYAWFSKRKEESAWNAIFDGGQQSATHKVYGVAEDCYKVVVSNVAGCSSELSMRYIQTDVGFADIDPLLNPVSSCLLNSNAGSVVLNLKNTGSKPLTREQKFKVSFSFGRTSFASGELFFSGNYEPGATIEFFVSGIDLAAELSQVSPTASRVDIRNLKLEIIDDWAVTTEKKLLPRVTLSQFGNPDPTVYLLKELSAADFDLSKLNSEYPRQNKLLSAVEGIKSGSIPQFANTYGNLLGYVSYKEGAETVKWKWRYKSGNHADLELAMKPASGGAQNCLVEFPQDIQTQWMKDNASTVGTIPGTLTPKHPDGLYTVEVIDNNGCRSRVQYLVEEKAYDLELTGVEPPKSACDLNPSVVNNVVRVKILNQGSMSVAADAELKLVVDRKVDGSVPPMAAWAQAAYAKFEATSHWEQTFKLGDRNGGNGLESGEMLLVEVPTTLYCEAKDDDGVVRSVLDGMSFTYEATVVFVDKEKYNESDTGNNKKVSVVVQDLPNPLVTRFYVESNGKDVAFPGVGGHYMRQVTDPEYLIVRFDVAPSTQFTTNWRLRGSLSERNYNLDIPKEIPGKTTGNYNVELKGTGEVNILVKTDGACEGVGSLFIMNNTADLFVSKITDGVPSELCPEDVSGARRVKVQLVNASPVPINTQDPAKPCGTGDLRPDQVTITLEDGLDPKNIIKLSKPASEVFGKKPLITYKQQEKIVNRQSEVEWVQDNSVPAVTAVGLSGFDTVEVAFDTDFILDGSKWSSGKSNVLKVTLDGGCEHASNTGNNTLSHSLVIRKSPDMGGVLTKAPYTFYVATGKEAWIEETWATTEALRKDMQWGPKGSLAAITATGEAPGSLSMQLNVQKAGVYELKVQSDKGCAASKDVEVKMPGFLTLVDGGVVVGPEDLIKGSCTYSPDSETLSLTVVNSGNEPLPLSGKMMGLSVKQIKDGIAAGATMTQLTHQFEGTPAVLNVGETVVVPLPDFKAKFGFASEGIYALEFALSMPMRDAVDQAPSSVRSGNEQKVEIRRYYQPTGTLALEKQVRSIFGATENLRALPKDREFTLYGLDNYAQPAGAEYKTLMDHGTVWTWYVDGTAMGDPSPDGYQRKFTHPNPNGKIKVRLETNRGCSLESDEVELHRLLEYRFSSISLTNKIGSLTCGDKSSVAVHRDITGSFTIEVADAPLKVGTQIDLTCRYTTSKSNGEQMIVVPVVLDRDYRQGEVVNFTAPIPFTVGYNVAKVDAGKYNEPISGIDWPVGGSRNVVEFTIKAGPTFKAPLVTPQESEKKPYTITLPEVEPGDIGDAIEYNWESGASTLPTYTVSVSKDYSVEILESNGCYLKANVRVDFYYKYSRTIAEGEGVVKVIDATTGHEYADGERIKDGTRVKIAMVAAAGYEPKGVVIVDENGTQPRTQAEFDYDVTADFSLQASFKKQSRNSVESGLLGSVVAINPFTNAIRIQGAESVALYSVYNQLGHEVLRGAHTLGERVLEMDGTGLQDGVYVVRLVDVEGGELVLRVVKAGR